MNNLEAAQAYLDRGVSVLPLKPRSKKPMGKWKGYQEKPITRDNVRAWWSVFQPAPGLGVITGPVSKDLVVLDIEPEHVRRVLREVSIPEGAAVAETARGGLHVYVRGKRRSGHLKLGGERVGDFRGLGGYVVAPPTPTDAGSYGWQAPLEEVEDLPAVPDWAEGGELFPGRFPLQVPTSHDLSGSTLSLRARVPTFVLSAIDAPIFTRLSPSELDFWVVCYLIRCGFSYAEVVAILEGSSLQAAWANSRGNRGPDYLERTFGNAWVQVETELAEARRVTCWRVVLKQGDFRSRERIWIQLWDPYYRRTLNYALPIVLADGSTAPQWRYVAEAFGVCLDDPLEVKGRSCYAVVAGRAEVRWLFSK